MAKRKNKFNIFDIITVLLLVIFAFVIIFAWDNKPDLGSKDVLVKINITNQEMIEGAQSGLDSAMLFYYSGTAYTVNEASHSITTDASGAKRLEIVVEGLGNIKPTDSIFLGQRIYLNQKVELRGDYFVQGYVTDYYYEN